MKHKDNPTIVRAGLLSLYVFLTAWAATGFDRTLDAIGLSLIAALGGWLDPNKPETDSE